MVKSVRHHSRGFSTQTGILRSTVSEPRQSLESAKQISAGVFGIGLGADYVIIPLMTAETFGIRVQGRLLGVILTADGVAEAVSPWLTGRLRDATGSYSTSCFLLVGMALLGVIAVLGLPGRRIVA
jgi:cyanate permease